MSQKLSKAWALELVFFSCLPWFQLPQTQRNSGIKCFQPTHLSVPILDLYHLISWTTTVLWFCILTYLKENHIYIMSCRQLEFTNFWLTKQLLQSIASNVSIKYTLTTNKWSRDKGYCRYLTTDKPHGSNFLQRSSTVSPSTRKGWFRLLATCRGDFFSKISCTEPVGSAAAWNKNHTIEKLQRFDPTAASSSAQI